VPIVDPDGPWLPSRAQASIASSGGGIAADAPTLARWGYLLYGGHLIDPDLVTQMTTDIQNDDWYGLGTQLGTLAAEPWVGHTGDNDAYHGKLVVFPNTDTAVAYLVPAGATSRFRPDLTDYDLTVQLRNAATTG
jgi:D-alanyl-D-alanine carboxypeptidase